MPESQFSSDEIARFVARIEGLPGWSRWTRRTGTHGEDVLELADGDGRPTLKIAKTAGGFVATGFAGWGLTVCDRFDDLLDVLSAFQPRPGPAAATSGRSRAA